MNGSKHGVFRPLFVEYLNKIVFLVLQDVWKNILRAWVENFVESHQI